MKIPKGCTHVAHITLRDGEKFDFYAPYLYILVSCLRETVETFDVVSIVIEECKS